MKDPFSFIDIKNDIRFVSFEPESFPFSDYVLEEDLITNNEKFVSATNQSTNEYYALIEFLDLMVKH